ncbi:MAG: hypothetical protein IJT68_00450 [Lentisphaeria bacterium]|nr:hypothetical protein [Lentisphaeria bacterium]
MQNDDTDFQAQEKRQAKSCLFVFLTVMLILFSLVIAAAAGVIVLDSIMLRGEEHTLSWRVKRYKVAAQFIWYDFKENVSKVFSQETQSVSCPVEPPEPESEPEPGTESEPESEPGSGL